MKRSISFLTKWQVLQKMTHSQKKYYFWNSVKTKIVFSNSKTKLGLIVILLTVIFASCQYFEKKLSKNDLLKKELQKIDWNEVDEYPSIGNCDILDNNEQQRQCFFEFLQGEIQHKLDSILVFDPKKAIDSLQVQVVVTPAATLEYQINNSNKTANLEVVDSVLKTPALQFKNIKPALKRGIPVKMQFQTAIMVNAR